MKISLLLACIITLALIGYTVANPIPVPTLIMPREYISIQIIDFNEALRVRVTGVYPFKNVDFRKVKMYFPVPYNVNWNTIKVYMDEKPIEWKVADWKYKTIIGDYPVIEWTISPVPDEFNVTVIYEQNVKPSKDGSFKILYAMATGRFLNKTYAKQCIAEVKIDFSDLLSNYGAKIASVSPPDMEFGGGYSTEVEVSIDCCREIVFRKASKPFRPLDEDILVAIYPLKTMEKWIPYTPIREDVKTELTVSDNEVSITVSITFRHAGFNVTWGSVSRKDNKFVVDAKVYEWTGPAAQVITVKKHTYKLGKLEPGSYEFEFKVNGVKIAESSFTIKSSSDTCTTSFSLLIIAIAAVLTKFLS
ncbi:MAG: hypothetical protein DRJ38_09050 [Thermoprotei archaeon]|nr:MAG: hypothetical protein DRJ38_09050 [Thermoprotei archaeon]